MTSTAPVEEAVIEPELPIIDSHHHLSDRHGLRYLLQDYLEDVGSGHNIVASVVVDTGAFYRTDGSREYHSVGETEFYNGAAAMAASGQYGKTQACAGIVGHVDLRLGDRAKPVLEAHAALCGGRLKGIRNTVTWDEDASLVNKRMNPAKELLLDKTFRAGIACLAPLGLSFDTWLYFTQLPDLIDLSRAFPQTTIILDHIGGPIGVGPYAGKGEEIFPVWRTRMAELARSPNVFVKLGGVGMAVFGLGLHGRANPPSSQEIATKWGRYVEACVEAFGPERCMFESDFPPDKETCSFRVIWNAFKRIAAQYSPAEKSALFSKSAATAYRLQRF